MRFLRVERHYYTATARKSAAILRTQRAARNLLPLFAELIAEGQRSVEEEHDHRAQARELAQAEWRARRAAKWQQGRAEFSRFDSALRRHLLDHWNRHRWLPGTPEYLLTMLHMQRTGRLDLDTPGMTHPKPVAHAQLTATAGQEISC